ncbi:MAG: preprotein translocase subunit SecE [Deltaproteobacteria bacterium]|nr:preprotein translocase subunit SecE [Deltaproteobacteria bacterium]
MVISYFAFAVLGGLFFEDVLQILFGKIGLTDKQLLGESWTLSTAIGFVLGFGCVLYAWVRKDIRDAAIEVAQEMRKVTWPSMAETRVSTIAVIVVSFVIAVFLGIFDFGWAEITKQIYEVPRYLGS